MKDKWITLDDAEHLYGISKQNMYIFNKNKKPNWLIKSKVDDTYYINIGYLLSIYNRRQKLLNETQQLYIKAEERYGKPYIAKEYAKRINTNKTNVYHIIRRLFSYREYSLTDINISNSIIEFNWFLSELLEPVAFDNIDEEYDYYELKRSIDG